MHLIPSVPVHVEPAHVATRPVVPLGLAGVAWLVTRPAPVASLSAVTPIGLWLVDLDDDRAPAGHELAAGVTSDEQARGARRRSGGDGQRWLRSHYALRRILGACLDRSPLSIEFHTNSSGQPHVDGTTKFTFSLAHSEGNALIAVSKAGDIGTDIERIRPGLHEEAIAHRVIGSRARAALEGVDPSRRTAEFFRLWVRHEAAVKCRGVSLVSAINRDIEHGLVITDVEAGDGYAAAWALDAATPPSVTPISYDWSF
jgi:4'-phosphopantetheinyl transferase